MTWKTTTFGEVVKLEQGLAFNKKNNYLIVDVGIPLLRITDLINKSESKFVDRNKVPLKFLSKPSDIIFTRTGQVGLVFKGRVGIVHNNCFRIIPIEGIDPNYVYWFLKQPAVIEYAQNLAGGVAQPDLAHDAFKSIPFRYPQYPDQQKIAAVLSAYDDLIENNTRRIKMLEEMAQAIYREWFINFRFPGQEDVRMVESELGLVPVGWEVRKLGDIAEEVRRNVEPNNLDSDTPYFGLEHIPRKSIALSDWGFAKDVQSTKHQFFKGEILFGKIRPYFHKVGVAPVDGVCSSDAIVIRPKKLEYFGLVLFCVSSEQFVSHATQTSQGTKMPRANWNVLVNYPVIIPPKPLLDKFNNVSSDMVDLIITKIFQNANLRSTRDLLLPKLIRGEIDVSGLDIRIPEAEA